MAFTRDFFLHDGKNLNSRSPIRHAITNVDLYIYLHSHKARGFHRYPNSCFLSI